MSKQVPSHTFFPRKYTTRPKSKNKSTIATMNLIRIIILIVSLSLAAAKHVRAVDTLDIREMQAKACRDLYTDLEGILSSLDQACGMCDMTHGMDELSLDEPLGLEDLCACCRNHAPTN
mmetsp:Transcript_13698/g.22347  ORF Transcript_13698/g.22347 Transcript_13698/m.22347 type:complete len:119 (+) Transcript_13698:1-357(+)